MDFKKKRGGGCGGGGGRKKLLALLMGKETPKLFSHKFGRIDVPGPVFTR